MKTENIAIEKLKKYLSGQHDQVRYRRSEIDKLESHLQHNRNQLAHELIALSQLEKALKAIEEQENDN